MKQFMLLFKGGDDVWDAKSEEEQNAHMEKWMQWIGQMAEEEKYVGGERLYPAVKTIHPGGTKITDRSFAEAKELVGGYITVLAETLDEATEMAKGCPGLLWESSVEVREVWPDDV
ncbi:hypothetical protein J8L88_13380 [Aquimarina sp. MMG015]|uniref:YciI family protein n=1 Tax=Aquimarina TaxID=290174 RepID=UPI0004865A99|nr:MULTISPECIES: YciI family protein [Aquimarina]AXT56064.1 hypothetical protein D1815_09980 [Aquimarina sp. AD1]MBQ4803849.1 hypothetical protein [Aquimarina sp. MMG015]RKN27020.1 hypothetical protein D7035_09185 [Aquimarina sp. AD1]